MTGAASGHAASRDAFTTAGRRAVELLGHEAVAARWEQLSALDQWSVAGLAGHLARGVLTVPGYLEAATAEGTGPGEGTEPVDPAGYFMALLQYEGGADLDSDLHRSIRERGEQQAAGGADALAEETAATLGQLLERLEGVSGDRPLQAFAGLWMTLDDYLATRVVELVVHTDDLAASVGLEPELPEPALTLATEVSLEIARRRRGDLTLLRALVRRERAPDGPLAM